MSYFSTPFAFDSEMAYLGIINGGSPYQYSYTSVPTDAVSYGANITWQDSRMQPTWAYIAPPSGPGWTIYDAWYQANVDTTAGAVDAALAAVTALIPTVAPVGISGSYADLTGKPTIPAAQVNSDWSASSGVAAIANKPSLLTMAYEGTTKRQNAFPIFKDATVSSGTAVFNLTSDGTSTGVALFPNGIIQDSINLTVNDATAAYQMSWALSNSNKTLTVTANKLTTANILTGILGQAAANSAVVRLSVWGY